MTIIQIIPLVLISAVVLVNLVTLVLWHLLYNLICQADPLVGAETGATYTSYLFNQLMQGGCTPMRRMESLGNPDRDRLIRAVKGSSGFTFISGIASSLKHVPLNFILMFK